MRIDSETVIGAKGLASGFIRSRGFSFILLPCDLFFRPLFYSLVSTDSDQALSINIVCLCVCYLHSKDTSPAPSRPSRARTSPVELRIFHQAALRIRDETMRDKGQVETHE